MKKILTFASLAIIGSTAAHAAVISTGNAKPTANVIDGFESTDTGQFAVNNTFATGSGQTWVSSQSIKIDAISLAFKAFDFDANPDSWTATLYTGWSTASDVTTGTTLWTQSGIVPTGSNDDFEYVTFDFTTAEETAIGTITAGTEYALVLNGGRGADFPFILRTESGATDSYTNGSGIWANATNSNTEDAYFAVQGTVIPEPSSVALLLGIGALATVARRRR